jgi:hypothetical protein
MRDLGTHVCTVYRLMGFVGRLLLTYDKRSGITTYDMDKTMNSAYLLIGNMSWNDMKTVLKTFDNGTGVLSLYAED